MSAPIEISIQRIPIIGLPALACIVKVDENGEALDASGEPVGGDRNCDDDGLWMVGAACVCERHWPMFCVLAGLDAEDIEAEWRDSL